MKRLMHLLGEPLPSGPDSHAALVRRLSQELPGQRPAIISAKLSSDVDELRRFRYAAMHSYETFDPRRAVFPVDAARVFVTEVDAAIARFRAVYRP